MLAASPFRLTGYALISTCGSVTLMRGLDLQFYDGLARPEGSASST